jgi:diacylglycerol kinase family enzyme
VAASRAVEAGFGGRDRTIDLARVEGAGGTWFAAMAGIGLDAAVVANAGLLPGGFTLLPRARLDDGLLDVGILAPSGTWDWIRLAGRVLARDQRQDRALPRWQAHRVRIGADAVLPRQVDGEIVPPGRALGVCVCPRALTVRLPG